MNKNAYFVSILIMFLGVSFSKQLFAGEVSNVPSCRGEECTHGDNNLGVVGIREIPADLSSLQAPLVVARNCQDPACTHGDNNGNESTIGLPSSTPRVPKKDLPSTGSTGIINLEEEVNTDKEGVARALVDLSSTNVSTTYSVKCPIDGCVQKVTIPSKEASKFSKKDSSKKVFASTILLGKLLIHLTASHRVCGMLHQHDSIKGTFKCKGFAESLKKRVRMIEEENNE